MRSDTWSAPAANGTRYQSTSHPRRWSSTTSPPGPATAPSTGCTTRCANRSARSKAATVSRPRRWWTPRRCAARKTVPRTSRGYDAGKRANGRKRHVVTDTCGWLLAVLVTGAHVQDRDAGHLLMWIIRTVFPTIRLVWADGGYAGKLVDYAATMLGITVQIVAKLAGQVGFVVLPHRWCVERTSSWINRCRRTVRDYERLPAHHAAMVYWAMIIVMGRRLARHQAAGRVIPQPARAP